MTHYFVKFTHDNSSFSPSRIFSFPTVIITSPGETHPIITSFPLRTITSTKRKCATPPVKRYIPGSPYFIIRALAGTRNHSMEPERLITSFGIRTSMRVPISSLQPLIRTSALALFVALSRLER